MWFLAILALGLLGTTAWFACNQAPALRAVPHDGESFARAQLQRRRRAERRQAGGYSLQVC
jgi:hypothetical protein